MLCAEQLQLRVPGMQLHHTACYRCNHCWPATQGAAILAASLSVTQSSGLPHVPSCVYRPGASLTFLATSFSLRLHLRRLQSQHVVVITWAASKLGHFQHELYDRLLWRAVAVRSVLHPQGVAMLLSSSARVGHRPDPRAVAQLLQVGCSCRPRHLGLSWLSPVLAQQGLCTLAAWAVGICGLLSQLWAAL